MDRSLLLLDKSADRKLAQGFHLERSNLLMILVRTTKNGRAISYKLAHP
jgi:hypothetical protein